MAVNSAARKPSDVKAEHDHGAQTDDAAEKQAIGNERRDDERVDGQTRRAGHEGRDQDGGDALALVLDGAGGHDGGHGAGIGREQRDEGLAVEADGTHDAVGDERGAGQVAGVLQNADEEEEQQDLGQEDEHRLDAVPQAVAQQQAQPVVGKQQRGMGAEPVSRRPRPSESGWPMVKTTWKTAKTTARKMSGPAMRWSRTESRRRVQSEAAGDW